TIQHTITPLVNLTPSQPSQLFTPINPITITPTHNTPKLLTHTLTPLPQPLKFHPSTNSILPTPTQIPTNTITIDSTHATPNKTTTKINYELTTNTPTDSTSTTIVNTLSTT
ncbi:hypothetical protein, partial [Staphylococcus epidermidis]